MANWTLYKEHLIKTIVLAYPICLSQLGHVLVGVADSIMVGNFGGEGSEIGALSLAGASLANSLFYVIMVFGIGVAYAITPLVAAADGEKDHERISLVLKHGILVSLLFGFGLLIILSPGSFFLKYVGQPPEVIALSVPYFNILLFSLIPLMIFLCFKQFTEGLSYSKQAMYITIVANILNVVLNYIFIYGKFGFPAMGLNGAGWSTLIARVVMALAIVVFVYRSKYFLPFRGGFSFSEYSKGMILKLLKLGIPIGMQFTFEVGAFAFAAVMMGWIGATELAAHQIAISLASVTYMLASGISSAVTVRVGNQMGSQNLGQMRLAGLSGFTLVFILMLLAAIFFISFNQFLPTLFNSQGNVLQVASVLIIIAAFFQLSDGIQVVGLGALRGMSDVKVPTLITVIAYWVIALPSAYVMGFYFHLGAKGIWSGLLVGLSFSAVALFYRFNKKSKKVLAASS
jgi:multidrug resistance protein, MATE family